MPRGRRVGQLGDLAEQRRDRVAELTRRGLSTKQIAEALGVTTCTVKRARRERGCQAPTPRPFDAAEIARAESLFADGCSCTEVARTLGRDPSTIWRRWPDRAWTKRQVAEYTAALRRNRAILEGL